MGARQKLNAAHFNGSLLVATAVGLIGQSWTLFGLTLVALIALGCHSGAIRHRPAGRHAGRGL